MPVFDGKGVMLNFIVDDVDAEYSRLTSAGLEVAMPLEDHPWGDRGFSILNHKLICYTNCFSNNRDKMTADK